MLLVVDLIDLVFLIEHSRDSFNVNYKIIIKVNFERKKLTFKLRIVTGNVIGTVSTSVSPPLTLFTGNKVDIVDVSPAGNGELTWVIFAGTVPFITSLRTVGVEEVGKIVVFEAVVGVLKVVVVTTGKVAVNNDTSTP